MSMSSFSSFPFVSLREGIEKTVMPLSSVRMNGVYLLELRTTGVSSVKGTDPVREREEVEGCAEVEEEEEEEEAGPDLRVSFSFSFFSLRISFFSVALCAR